jgi:protein-tyrosine phosphatase
MQTPIGPSPDQPAHSLVGPSRAISLQTRAQRLASLIRRFPERALHPLRRGKVRRLLAISPFPRSILVVCYGNVCRSPYAASALMRALPEQFREVQVTSAGFVGPGRSSPTDAISVAAEMGIDLTPHRSQVLTPGGIDAAQLILVMDANQQTAVRRRFGKPPERVLILGDFDPEPIEKRAIRDPWNQSVEVFEDSYRRIDRCVAELVSALIGSDPSAGA